MLDWSWYSNCGDVFLNNRTVDSRLWLAVCRHRGLKLCLAEWRHSTVEWGYAWLNVDTVGCGHACLKFDTVNWMCRGKPCPPADGLLTQGLEYRLGPLGWDRPVIRPIQLNVSPNKYQKLRKTGSGIGGGGWATRKGFLVKLYYSVFPYTSHDWCRLWVENWAKKIINYSFLWISQKVQPLKICTYCRRNIAVTEKKVNFLICIIGCGVMFSYSKNLVCNSSESADP
jgi:hypothetical protein